MLSLLSQGNQYIRQTTAANCIPFPEMFLCCSFIYWSETVWRLLTSAVYLMWSCAMWTCTLYQMLEQSHLHLFNHDDKQIYDFSPSFPFPWRKWRFDLWPNTQTVHYWRVLPPPHCQPWPVRPSNDYIVLWGFFSSSTPCPGFTGKLQVYSDHPPLWMWDVIRWGQTRTVSLLRIAHKWIYIWQIWCHFKLKLCRKLCVII